MVATVVSSHGDLPRPTGEHPLRFCVWCQHYLREHRYGQRLVGANVMVMPVCFISDLFDGRGLV
jgi:hypothetical protein